MIVEEIRLVTWAAGRNINIGNSYTEYCNDFFHVSSDAEEANC